jgi:hypothetical protein
MSEHVTARRRSPRKEVGHGQDECQLPKDGRPGLCGGRSRKFQKRS